MKKKGVKKQEGGSWKDDRREGRKKEKRRKSKEEIEGEECEEKEAGV